MIDTADPVAILEALDADTLRRRLDDLDAARAAVLTLLRAARARERSRCRGTHRPRKVPHASPRHPAVTALPDHP
jgi:hypothetical protein